MDLLKSINLGIRFILEISTLIAVGMYGFSLSQNVSLRVIFASVIPVIIAVVWGIFVAPKAPHHIKLPWRLIMEITIFGIATLALIKTNHSLLAMIFAITVIVNQILLFMWRQ